MALKSPAASANWPAVERVFEQTLNSVCAQTDSDYSVIVVCNEMPRLTRPALPRVQFVVRDLPVPDVKARTETMLDKWTKIAHGLIVAKELRPDFVMLMDADDLVSSRLAAFANSHKSSNGWIFKNGYCWHQGARWVEYSRSFNCGTNAIVSHRLIDFPADVSTTDKERCVILKNGHTTIEEALREQNTPLDPLPFPGAMWVIGHGDNWTSLQGEDGAGLRWGVRDWVHAIRSSRFLSKSLKREFGLGTGV